MCTAHPDVDALLDLLVPGLREALAERLCGLYLFGSVVTGDYDPGVSDVDLLAVVERPLAQGEVHALGALYARAQTSQPEWDDRIEVLHVSRAALRTFRERATPIAVISPGEPLNVKPAGIEWLMNWWQVREFGQVLFGPPPSEFIAPISDGEYVAVIRDYAREFPMRLLESGRRKWHSYVTLTMCRSMYTSQFGGAISKRAAALWASQEFPKWAPLLEQALAVRLDPSENGDSTPQQLAETQAFADFALERIAAHEQ